MSKAIISIIMAIITVISSFLGFDNPFEEKEKEFVPVVRFMVCSDTHISGRNVSQEKMASAINNAYAIAQQNENYSVLDALMFVGDLTDNGEPEQFEIFKETIDTNMQDETKLLAIAAKNHDSWTYGKQSALSYVNDMTGNGSDFHVVINGFHFIGLSTSKKDGQRYGLYQRTWLRKQLKEAANDDPNKPIFVCQHEHIRNTVYGSSNFEGWGVTDFKDIYKQYPQIVHFSGHSHYPNNDPRSIYQKDYTAVGTGAINYMELTVDSDRSIHPDTCAQSGQAWIVEVDRYNRVQLKSYDITDGEILCQYLIKNPSDKSTFEYTEEKNEASSSAPAFDSDCTMKVENADGKYNVTVPAAKSTDGKIIFLYRIYVLNEKGKTVSSDYIVNNYWLPNPYSEVSFTVDAKTGYTVRVVAENAYGMQSECLEAVI